MKKLLLGGVAAAALVGMAPAIAQTTAPTGPAPKAHAGKGAWTNKEITRAEVDAQVRQTFARLDANRDGYVTREEVNAAREQIRTRIGERRLQTRAQMFDMLDQNKDGVLSRGEWEAGAAMAGERRVMVRRAGPDGERVARRGGSHRMGMGMGFTGQMFELADANRDGRVSLQEALDAAMRRFDTADLNRDGRITPDERQQLRQRMMQERRSS